MKVALLVIVCISGVGWLAILAKALMATIRYRRHIRFTHDVRWELRLPGDVSESPLREREWSEYCKQKKHASPRKR